MSELDVQLLLTAIGSVLLLVALIVSRIRLHPLLALLIVSIAVGFVGALKRDSRHSEHCLDAAHHRDEPWSDIACQLTLAEQERGDAAIENKNRSVGHRTHRHRRTSHRITIPREIIRHAEMIEAQAVTVATEAEIAEEIVGAADAEADSDVDAGEAAGHP